MIYAYTYGPNKYVNKLSDVCARVLRNTMASQVEGREYEIHLFGNIWQTFTRYWLLGQHTLIVLPQYLCEGITYALVEFTYLLFISSYQGKPVSL